MLQGYKWLNGNASYEGLAVEKTSTDETHKGNSARDPNLQQISRLRPLRKSFRCFFQVQFDALAVVGT